MVVVNGTSGRRMTLPVSPAFLKTQTATAGFASNRCQEARICEPGGSGQWLPFGGDWELELNPRAAWHRALRRCPRFVVNFACLLSIPYLSAFGFPLFREYAHVS